MGKIRLLIVLLLVANGWLQYTLWFGDLGIVRWQQTEEQLALVSREVHDAQRRVDELNREIRLLEKEPQVLEETARRELGLVHPDEIIFLFP